MGRVDNPGSPRVSARFLNGSGIRPKEWIDHPGSPMEFAGFFMVSGITPKGWIDHPGSPMVFARVLNCFLESVPRDSLKGPSSVTDGMAYTSNRSDP